MGLGKGHMFLLPLFYMRQTSPQPQLIHVTEQPVSPSFSLVFVCCCCSCCMLCGVFALFCVRQGWPLQSPKGLDYRCASPCHLSRVSRPLVTPIAPFERKGRLKRSASTIQYPGLLVFLCATSRQCLSTTLGSPLLTSQT